MRRLSLTFIALSVVDVCLLLTIGPGFESSPLPLYLATRFGAEGLIWYEGGLLAMVTGIVCYCLKRRAEQAARAVAWFYIGARSAAAMAGIYALAMLRGLW